MLDVITWYGLVMLLGLLALPFCFVIFKRLPDKGYALSKPLGVLLVSLVAWWIASLKLLAFDHVTCWLAVLGLGLAGNALLLGNRTLCEEMGGWFKRRHNWGVILATELVFLAGFAFIINLRSFFPELDKSEKFFDLAFIQAIAATPTLPAPDPWFGGQPMNYYFGGQLLMGVLVKLAGTPAAIAYNIQMGVVFGMAACGALGFAGNAVGLFRAFRAKNGATTENPDSENTGNDKTPFSFGQFATGFGILGGLFIMWLGNFYPVRQALWKGFAQWGDKNWPFYVEWAGSARMIYDPMPDGRMLDILTEYPVYSYLNGDLHAHLLGAPYVHLALGFILNLFARTLEAKKWQWRNLGEFVPAGLTVGGLYFINGGDFPIYAGLMVLTLLLVESLQGGAFWKVMGRFLAQMAVFGVALYGVYLFYMLNFTGMLRGQPLAEAVGTPVIEFMSKYVGWIWWPRTFLGEYVMMYGLFFFAIVSFMGLKLGLLAKLEQRAVTLLSAGSSWAVRICGLLLAGVGGWSLSKTFSDLAAANLKMLSVALPAVCFSAAVWTIWPRAWETLRRTPRLTVEIMLGALLWLVGPVVDFELLGPVTLVTYFALRLLVNDWRQNKLQTRLDMLVLLMVAFAGLITLFCELFYIRDIYANRFNTMMKFWYQLWVLFGLAGGYAVYRVLSWQKQAESENYGLVANSPIANQKITKPKLAFVNPFVALMQAEPQVAEGLPLTVSSPEKIEPSPVINPARSATPLQPSTSAKAKWQKGWLALLVVLITLTLPLPTLAYWQATNGYNNRLGLNGEAWYSSWAPADYNAMVWLRNYTWQNASRRGVVLEANGMNYSWANRVSTFTGLPTVVGWPFHELQWRGYLEEKEIWESWLDMSRIYETTDVEQAKKLMAQHHVRYVFVGQVENGSRSFYPDLSQPKEYPPEALAKFGTFMQTIYADPENNVYIYALY